jgi:hypothetical protein
MRLPLIFCTLALVLRPLSAADAVAGLDPQNLKDASALSRAVDAASKSLADAQARLDDMEPQIDDLGTAVKKNRYGGASNPEISGSYGALFKDVDGFGLADRHGVAMLLGLDISILVHMDDGGTFAGGFSPVFTPGAYPTWVVDDTDELHKGTGTATRSGTLLGSFQMNYRKGPLTGEAGFQSFQTSVLTLSGPLSDRPILFDKNPYMTNISSKAYYEGQFLTGVPKRSPEESEHYIMGLRSTLDLQPELSLMTFIGDYEGFYDNDTLPHEFGGTLGWDHSDASGSKLKLIAYNRTNDTGEIVALGGNPNDPYFGQMNNTVISLMADQKLGPTQAELEVANSDYQDPSGILGGIHTVGQAIRLETTTNIGDSTLRLNAYTIAPGYLVIDPSGKYNANGANLMRYREDLDHPGGIIQQTVVGDPTLPINDSTTYSVGSQVRFGNTFFNMNLQNSMQRAPTDARIWSSHYEGGGNLSDGTWFQNFNNNYQAWLPPSGTTPMYGKNPGLEREFFYNPQRDGVTASVPTTITLNDYDMNYAPDSRTAGSLGAIRDQTGKYYYNAYHQLETNLWERNYEGIVNSDPVTGLALSPSTKTISDASLDMRMNISDYLPLGRPLYWELYSELLTVNDTLLLVPSTDPWNLFVQGIVDSTLVYNMRDDVVLLLNLGIENWTSDRMPLAFFNNNEEMQRGILEYHDREAGVGLDWNALPGKLNLYFRAKLLDHYDSASYWNSFQSKQLMAQMKTYF